MSESIGPAARTRTNIVEQILEQGQRLRNAMVKSILDNDPFYIDVVDKSTLNKAPLVKGSTFNSYDSDEALRKRISDDLTRINLAKEAAEAKKTGVATSETVNNQKGRLIKHTSTDSDVQTRSESQSEAEEITKSIQDNYRSRAADYFKYVNSLKITIHSLSLNQAGTRKVSVSAIDLKYKLPTSISHSYFVEYSVPDCLTNTEKKSRSKVDSGLSGNLFRICSKKNQNEEIYFKHTSIHDIVNLLQLNLQDVEIKVQVSCRTMKQKRATVLGYATFNMSSFEVTKHLCCTEDFPVVSEDFTFGTLKMTLQLGCGRMYFGREFVEFVIGNMKSSESTTIRSENRNLGYNTPSSEQGSSVIFVDNKISAVANKHANVKNGTFSNQAGANAFGKTRVELPSEKPISSITSRQQSSQTGITTRFANEMALDEKLRREGIASSVGGTNVSEFQSDGVKENTNFFVHSSRTANTELENKSLLYGLIYVSEAQYFEGAINSYLSCQAFGQGDTLCSRVVYNTKEPVFNFYQKLPFLFNDDFLLCMRDGAIIVDFWERYDDEDIAIGSSQLSLHQFYIAYRNNVIADTLLQNRLPVTISDWWEPICSSVNGKIYGQMKVLVAVGTAAQIHNLEVERGLKDTSVTVTYVPIVPEARNLKKRLLSATTATTDQSSYSFKRPEYLRKSTKGSKRNVSTSVVDKGKKLKDTQFSCGMDNDGLSEVKKIDVGVQSDVNMEAQDNSEAQGTSKTESMLETFITHLIGQKQKNIYVENATNTENIDIHNNLSKNLNNERLGNSTAQSLNKLSQCKNATNSQLRKTSDLLDYLNDALSGDNKVVGPQTSRPPPPLVPLIEDENLFKAHVVVEGALHLPCRKKCKSKRSRRKNVSYEEALPSTYVTFETIPGADLKISPVVPRSANPQWDFRCDVLLPGEILTSSQKRFIFKVWRKNNSSSPNPNLQTDVVLGFAALDLTVLLAGLPSVQGWFNIVDFSSKCNGQIKIHVTPLENILRFSEPTVQSPEPISANSPLHTLISRRPLVRALAPVREEPSELLNRALKRKFTELEEITQRLRSRLADVTKDDSDASNDEFADEFERDINSLCVEDDYNMIDLVSLAQGQGTSEADLLSMQEGEWPRRQLETDTSRYLLKEVDNDRIGSLSQFASSDIPIFSKGTFVNESSSKFISTDSAYGGSTHISDKTVTQPFVGFNFASSTSASESGSQILQISSPNRLMTPGDRQLLAGKQRIDTLLEKLTLLSGTDAENVFPSRYVSGCSVNQESDMQSMKDADGGLNVDALLNSSLFNQLCSFDRDSSASLTEPSEALCSSSSNAHIDNGSSSNSLLTQFSTYRQAPEGAGNSASVSNMNNKQNV